MHYGVGTTAINRLASIVLRLSPDYSSIIVRLQFDYTGWTSRFLPNRSDTVVPARLGTWKAKPGSARAAEPGSGLHYRYAI